MRVYAAVRVCCRLQYTRTVRVRAVIRAKVVFGGVSGVRAAVEVSVRAAPCGRIAQSVERSANNAVVLGSSPSMTIAYTFARLPSNNSMR